MKQTFTKKGVSKFSKKKHFWNQQGVSFRVVCFVCFEPSDPFQRTVRWGESVTAERQTAPVDTFQAGQILSVIARETYTVSKLPKQRCRLTASLTQVGRAFGYQFSSLVWGLGFAPEQRSLFFPKQIKCGQFQRIK